VFKVAARGWESLHLSIDSIHCHVYWSEPSAISALRPTSYCQLQRSLFQDFCRKAIMRMLTHRGQKDRDRQRQTDRRTDGLADRFFPLPLNEGLLVDTYMYRASENVNTLSV